MRLAPKMTAPFLHGWFCSSVQVVSIASAVCSGGFCSGLYVSAQSSGHIAALPHRGLHTTLSVPVISGKRCWYGISTYGSRLGSRYLIAYMMSPRFARLNAFCESWGLCRCMLIRFSTVWLLPFTLL